MADEGPDGSQGLAPVDDGVTFYLRNGRRGYNFVESEIVATATVDYLIKEVEKHSFNKKVRARCWAFAAETAVGVMLSQLDMTYCYMETPEPIEGPGWTMQEELEPATIDFWARRALPIVKKKKPGAAGAGTQRRSLVGAGPKKDERQYGAKAQHFDVFAQVSEDGRKEKIPEEYIPDEEEVRYREAKLLEEKKRKDETTKAATRKREEELERSKVEATEQQMLKKPYTFDTEGNILWVELPNINKLPKTAVELPYKHREQVGSKQHLEESPPPANKTPKGPGVRISPEKRKKSFQDGFTKLPLEQPNIVDIIDLKPGVKLLAAGKSKQGPTVEDETMTITGYQRLIASQEN